MSDRPDPATKHFESWLEWRRDRWIKNLRDVSGLPEADGESFPPRNFPQLPVSAPREDAISKSLRNAVLIMSCEAVEAFVFGCFQACVLAVGATLERVLKLEYRLAKGALPAKGNWTLGRCAYNLDWNGTRINAVVLDPIKELLSPRNSRAHALLEHSDPETASRGGPNRGLQILSNSHYVIEPYRGEAFEALTTMHKVLGHLYRPQV